MVLGIGKRVASATGRGISSMGSNKFALGALGIGAATLGFANNVAPAARDAAFDYALGDPNADVAFTGRKIDTRYLLGNAMGGTFGSIAKLSSPSDSFAFDASAPGPVNLLGSPERGAIGLGIGSVVGGAVGAFAGGGKGAVIGAGIGGFLGGTGGLGSIGSAPLMAAGGTVAGATYGATKGFSKGPFKGLLGMGLGAAAGGMAGTAVGGAMIAGSMAPTVGATLAYTKANEQFFSESPLRNRSSSLDLLSSTNAVGDIVLGMHNSRRGY